MSDRRQQQNLSSQGEVGRQTEPAGPQDPESGSGTLLGHYRIVALLGRGGMGEVYQAEDTLLRRPVAIKTLPRSAGTDEAHWRGLLREAQAVARLSHPHV